MRYLILILIVALIGGCAVIDRFDSRRDAVVDRIEERWCGLTESEKEALAERRDYSEETAEWLESRCE